ncbi:MAG: 4Fe-4S dicluster domain-containing protein [Spirochaetales bacterium]|nr:4Fe-4S dicluster domain-containing protein [Spirochaetales bacterium]
MLYFIEQTNIKNLIVDLIRSWSVFAPVEQEEKDVLLEKLPENSAELEKYLGRISLNSRTANKQILIPPKEAFFPQSEVMFTYSSVSAIKKEYRIGNSAPDTDTARPVLFFGIKPCDYYALNITGSFFKNGFEDFYYLSKSKNYLALVFGCIIPPEPESCYCSSAGTGPVLSKEKGQDFDKALTVMEKGSRAEGSTAKLLNNAYSKIEDRCIYCGGCLYVCPTCTCFNVYDSTESTAVASERTSPLNGERVRVWDACVFSGYTREASGNNPRGEAYTRAARRYEHKLKYDPAVYGRSSCTDCGRCLTVCPVNIGILTFTRGITENHEK